MFDLNSRRAEVSEEWYKRKHTRGIPGKSLITFTASLLQSPSRPSQPDCLSLNLSCRSIWIDPHLTMSGSVAVVSAPPAASSSVAASVVVPSSAAPSGSAAPASVAASIVPSSQPLPLSSSPPSAAPTTLTTSTTPASITASASASGEPFCVAFQDPHVGSTGTEYCMCGTETTSYYVRIPTHMAILAN